MGNFLIKYLLLRVNKMSDEKRTRKKRRKNIFTVTISILIFYVLFSSFSTLFKRNTKTILPERVIITDSISSQGFSIKKESVINSANSGVLDLIANEGERLAAGRKVLSINTSKDMSSLEYELKEIEENISSLEEKETSTELIKKEKDKIQGTREELILELQNKISSNEFNDISYIKEKLLLYDEKHKEVDFSNSLVGQSIENLKNRKENISKEIGENHVNYYTSSGGVISYEIDGYEEIYLPKDFENYTYEKLNMENVSKITREDKSNISINEPIFKIIDNFKWYMAIKIEDIKEISDFSINNNINISIDNDEEIQGKILAINTSKKKAVIIVEFNTMFQKYYKMRFPKVNIIKSKIEGYKIPKKSIVKVDNINGVYIKDRGGIVRFKPVSIIKEESKYVYIHTDDKNTNKEITLFDEILINPNNIKEGDIL